MKPTNLNDLIRIEDALRVLCRKTCTPGIACPDGYCVEMWEEFEDVKRVDAVSVIRCRDCKYWAEDMTTNVYLDGKRYRFCKNYGFNLAENDYCSRAEHRK